MSPIETQLLTVWEMSFWRISRLQCRPPNFSSVWIILEMWFENIQDGYNDGWPSWISDWIDLSPSEYQCHHYASHQFSAQSMVIFWLKDFKVTMAEIIMNLHVAPTLPPRDCSIPLNFWKQMWWMTSKMAVKATLFFIRQEWHQQFWFSMYHWCLKQVYAQSVLWFRRCLLKNNNMATIAAFLDLVAILALHITLILNRTVAI